MTKERYWVVGGDYTCTGFNCLKEGQAAAMGPYEDRREAEQAWKQVSEETRSRATARYSITSEQLVLPQ